MFFGRWKTDISKDGRMEVRRGAPANGVPRPWRRNRLMDDVRMMRPAEAADALGVSLARPGRLWPAGDRADPRWAPPLPGGRRARSPAVAAVPPGDWCLAG